MNPCDVLTCTCRSVILPNANLGIDQKSCAKPYPGTRGNADLLAQAAAASATLRWSRSAFHASALAFTALWPTIGSRWIRAKVLRFVSRNDPAAPFK
jgi:hypothetical protein